MSVARVVARRLEQPEALLPRRVLFVDDADELVPDAVALRDRGVLTQAERRQIADGDHAGRVGSRALSAEALRQVDCRTNRLHCAAGRYAKQQAQEQEQGRSRRARVQRSGWHGQPSLG